MDSRIDMGPSGIYHRFALRTATDKNSDIILVGERANGPREQTSRKFESELEKRLVFSAFCDGPSRQKLVSLGAQWRLALNLLPSRPLAEATFTADERISTYGLVEQLLDYAHREKMRVLLAGSRPAEIFRLGTEKGAQKPFTVETVMGVEVGCVPHPSGRNYLWNSVDTRRVAIEFLRGFCQPDANALTRLAAWS